MKGGDTERGYYLVDFSISAQNLTELGGSVMKKFLKDEEGVTAIEYGLLASLVALALITGAGLVGTWLDGIFTTISNQGSVPSSP